MTCRCRWFEYTKHAVLFLTRKKSSRWNKKLHVPVMFFSHTNVTMTILTTRIISSYDEIIPNGIFFKHFSRDSNIPYALNWNETKNERKQNEKNEYFFFIFDFNFKHHGHFWITFSSVRIQIHVKNRPNTT